jgi:hypothetical protein
MHRRGENEMDLDVPPAPVPAMDRALDHLHAWLVLGRIIYTRVRSTTRMHHLTLTGGSICFKA